MIRNPTGANKGPDFNAKTDEQEPQDEVVFTDPTVDEVEKRPSIGVTEVITNTSSRQTTALAYDIPTCGTQEQKHKGLPTPQATAEPDPQVSKIRLDAEDVVDIVHEAPIPSNDPIEGLSTPEATPERDLRASKIEIIQLDAENVADIARGAPIPATPERSLGFRNTIGWRRGWDCSRSTNSPENSIEGLPTPETTLERDLQPSEIRLDAEYVADIAREVPIPPGNPLPTPEAMPERYLQASKIQLDAECVADIFHKAT